MDDFEKFYNKSLRFLSFRPRSEQEIRNKLKSKKADSLIINKVIEKLKEQKFVNDEEFAKWWVEQRTSFRPLGLRLIKIELRQKGISEGIIGKIYDLRFNIDDLEQARKLIEKKLPRYKGLPKQELYQKLGRFLARRGFDWETIKQAIDEVVKKGYNKNRQ